MANCSEVLEEDRRSETTIRIRVVEAKNLPPARELRTSRDTYVVVGLDQEEIFRTATVEKSLCPYFGEEYSFTVPRAFRRLSFYVCEPGLHRDSRLGKVAISHDDLRSDPSREEAWYPIHPVDPDSEVQGKMHLSLSVAEKLVFEGEVARSQLVLSVRVMECCGLGAWGGSGLSDPVCQVMLLSSSSGVRSEVKRGQVHKRTVDPMFYETFDFPIESEKSLQNALVRVSVFHTGLLSDDVFLGQVNLSLSSMDTKRLHSDWYLLTPRPPPPKQAPIPEIGSMRLSVNYSMDYIYPLRVYEPLKALLLKSLTCQDLSDSVVHILSEVYRDRAAMARSLLKIFLQLNKLEELMQRVIDYEVNNTVDPNTLFRGNSLASKAIDEFMKLVGQSYLQKTLQCCIDEIFDARRHCEIDPSRLSDGDHLDLNMANLLFFIEKILSAIVSSARSCPRLMCTVFAMLKEAAIRKFPGRREVIGFTAVSGFVFLRFFAPGILNPKLFDLRPQHPGPVVARTLTLISKSIQSLGNLGGPKHGSLQHKETYMTPIYMQLTDHIRDVKDYLTAVSHPQGGVECPLDHMVYREGFVVKRSQGRKKGPKNFRKRYFCLTSTSLTYSKNKGDSPLCTIPAHELLAVERVDDNAFGMKFMLQLQQPERILYMQAKNSVDLMEWLIALSRACLNGSIESYHSGAYLNNAWTCCGAPVYEINKGCKPISLAVKMLAHREDIDLERELHKVYKMFLHSQTNILKLKDDVTSQARSEGQVNGGDPLPIKLANLCELLVFVKNLELSTTTHLSSRGAKPGSREAPFSCEAGEALVLR